MARRLRQVVDLYAEGQVQELKDGTPVFIRPLNPFEQDTARSEAQIARSRIQLAIREEGEDEQYKVRMWFEDDGVEAARDRLVASRVHNATTKMFEDIRNDPDWTERLKIMDRGAEQTASNLEETEVKLLAKIANEFAAELGQRISAEREYQLLQLSELNDDQLWIEYLDWFISERGSDVMLAEYRLHQCLYGVRWCDGVKDEETGRWDHTECNGHQDPLFATKEAVRTAPEGLLDVLYIAIESVDMSAREAKNSRRQGSSSGSSPLPSEGEASTASTRTETQPEPHGSSSLPSAMPSPSSAGVS